MAIKFYMAPASQPSRAVAWFIETHNLKEHFEVVLVDLDAGEASTPEFRAKNVFESVPMLELEEGVTISESSAILIYLTKRFGIKGELAEDPLLEAKAMEALLRHEDLARLVTTGMLRKVSLRVENRKATWNDVKAEVAKDEVHLRWAFSVLDSLLSKNDCVCGATWSLVDYLVAAEISQWPDMCIMLPDSLQIARFPNIQRYFNNVVMKRAGYQQFIAPFKFLVNHFGLASVGHVRDHAH